MKEYLENSARLGWLIAPNSREVEIYRQGESIEILDSPISLSGENILSGFVLNLEKIW